MTLLALSETAVGYGQLALAAVGLVLFLVWSSKMAHGENLLPEGPSPTAGFGIVDAVVVIVLWLAAEFAGIHLAMRLGLADEARGFTGNGYLIVKSGHLLVVAYAMLVLARSKEHGRRGAGAAAGALSALAFLPIALAVLHVTQMLVEAGGGEWVEQDVLGQLRQEPPWKFAFIAVVLAPVTEEVLFRGTIYLAMKRVAGPTSAAIVSALLFALVHPPYHQFGPAIFVLGLALVYVYETTGSLVAPMAFHATFNLFTVAGELLVGGG